LKVAQLENQVRIKNPLHLGAMQLVFCYAKADSANRTAEGIEVKSGESQPSTILKAAAPPKTGGGFSGNDFTLIGNRHLVELC
jgi:hypothetical protein